MSHPYYNINAAVSNEIIREVGEEKNDWICIKWTVILQEGIYTNITIINIEVWVPLLLYLIY